MKDLETKIEELLRENEKLNQQFLQESDIKEKIMIESKSDKESFSQMKK